MIKFENPINGRFYYLDITKDMISDLVIRVIYGGKCVVRTRNIPFHTQSDLQHELDRMCKRRIKRGYLLIQ